MKKVLSLKTCTTRIDFLNLIFPGEGSKNKYLKVIFALPDNEKYTQFEIPKKSGGTRKILAPVPELKKIQKRLAIFLIAYYEELHGEKNNYAHAFLKEKSIITNAKQHRNKNLVLNIDLEDFFPTITFGRIRNYFMKNRDFELPHEIATLIAKIACYEGYLPQGSPCSPILSNFICQILDVRLAKLARKNKCHYSRYADDLSFSTNSSEFSQEIAFWRNGQALVGKQLTNEILRAGFRLNEKKTRIYEKGTRQEVTSLVVNKKVNVSRKYFDDTKAMAFKYYKTGFCEINGKPGTYKQILGRFNFINQIEKYNNKLFFKRSEKHLPKNILVPHNEEFNGTNQKDKKSVPLQFGNISKSHTYENSSYHIGYNYLSAREQAYSKFLYYSTFIINERPIILTEGKSDILYIKAALKNMHQNYPDLIERRDDKFHFKISFYKVSKLNRYLLHISPNGEGILRVLNPKYIFPKNSLVKKSAVILLLDNEKKGGKPLASLTGNSPELRKLIEEKEFSILDPSKLKKGRVSAELFQRFTFPKFFLLTIPRKTNEGDFDIESLFDDSFLESQNFRSVNTGQQTSKNNLSKYVLNNYKEIDFSKFIPLLDHLVEIIKIEG